MKDALNIATICEEGTYELGPGKRFAFWVQGCPFACKNCIAPEWIEMKVQKWLTITDLAENICAKTDIEGITISGGEPFLQAGKIALLLQKVKERKPTLNNIIFTGFDKEELIWDGAKELLAVADVVITGKYIESLNDNQGLRGSSNQIFHFLSDAFQGKEDYFYHKERNVEYHISNQQVLMVGVPPKHFQ